MNRPEPRRSLIGTALTAVAAATVASTLLVVPTLAAGAPTDGPVDHAVEGTTGPDREGAHSDARPTDAATIVSRSGTVGIDHHVLPGPSDELFESTLTSTGSDAPVDLAHADPALLTPELVETFFLRSINTLRIEHGMRPLRLHDELVDEARAWTDELAGAGTLRHANDLSVGVTERWALLGENVGQSVVSLQVLFDAFVSSPTHLENILEPGFDSIGVGATIRGGRVFTVHRFMDVVGTPRAARLEPALPSSIGAPQMRSMAVL